MDEPHFLETAKVFFPEMPMPFENLATRDGGGSERGHAGDTIQRLSGFGFFLRR
jgi:hypothetical protein